MASLRALRDRELWAQCSPSRIRETVSGSLNLLHRLKLDRLLDGHAGCVNTLSWNHSGEFLLSGSDDLRIVIWNSEGMDRNLHMFRTHALSMFYCVVVRTHAKASYACMCIA